MIRARLLGFERETVIDEIILERVEFSLRFPRLRRHPSFTEASDPHDIDIVADTYELERVLPIDDGGPLAIYGRVS